jgi:hypothetical protein
MLKDYINKKSWSKESVSERKIRRSKQRQSPRKILTVNHTHEVMMERSRKGVLEFSTGWILNNGDLHLPQVGA